MQLLLAVIQVEDADDLCSRLNEQGFRVTRITTAGGFLHRRNVTVLVGVEDEQVESVIAVFRSTCRTRRSFINASAWGAEPTHLALTGPAPLEVEIGGATIFSFPVKRFERLQGGTRSQRAEKARPISNSTIGETHMDLMLAIVQSDDADQVTQALIDSNFRLTRINSAGGFLRRGNATLLIGVDSEREDEALDLIEANCQPRKEANPVKAGMPSHSATVFVLETKRLVRV